MRMWMINPVLLCSRHLVGEHGELHKFLSSFGKRHGVAGRVAPVVQIELSSYQSRHDELAAEMERRRPGSHKSPLTAPDLSYLPSSHYLAKVDREESIRELCRRCPECREKIVVDIYHTKA